MKKSWLIFFSFFRQQSTWVLWSKRLLKRREMSWILSTFVVAHIFALWPARCVTAHGKELLLKSKLFLTRRFAESKYKYRQRSFFTAFFPHICYPIYICIAGPAGGSVTWPPSGTTYIIALLASSTARVTSTSKVFCRHRSDTRYVEIGSLSHLELSWETWLLVHSHMGPITKSQEEGEMNL